MKAILVLIFIAAAVGLCIIGVTIGIHANMIQMHVVGVVFVLGGVSTMREACRLARLN